MKDWALTQSAFHRLLIWLGGEGGDDGERYLEMRRRLVGYFDRRNCSTPDELADDVLNRVARRLEEAGVIETDAPAKYCYTVARFVLMEHRRDAQKVQRLAGDIPAQPPGQNSPGGAADEHAAERMLGCLDQCAARLQPRDRDTILRYYAGTGRPKIEARRELAKALGISVNALRIRACRLRDALHECVRRCVRAR